MEVFERDSKIRRRFGSHLFSVEKIQYASDSLSTSDYFPDFFPYEIIIR